MRELTIDERARVSGGLYPYSISQAIAAGAAYVLAADFATVFGPSLAAGTIGSLAASFVAYCW